MTSFEPPSGMPDLAGQVTSIEDERAKAAAERAELDREWALVRQRRAQEDARRPEVLEPSSEQFIPEQDPVRPYTPAVVDSNGEEFERDIETGEVILDGFGAPIPKWKHQTIEFDGEPLQIRKPAPQAIQAFAMAASKYTPNDIRIDMMNLFVKNHISPLSYGRLLARMMDPDDTFTVESFGRVIEKIATLDTGRPTGPS